MSLSLAGPCVMELRRGGVHRALHLPPRSLLVLAGEARLAWHHYIPHRRADTIAGRRVPRASRRISFTFRKVPLSVHGAFQCPPKFFWSNQGVQCSVAGTSLILWLAVSVPSCTATGELSSCTMQDQVGGLTTEAMMQWCS